MEVVLRSSLITAFNWAATIILLTAFACLFLGINFVATTGKTDAKKFRNGILLISSAFFLIGIYFFKGYIYDFIGGVFAK